MKNITKILLLVFLLIGSSAIEAYCSIVVTIHIARHRDCKGFGWCKFEVYYTVEIVPRPIGNQVNAVADINRSGHLLLTFNKKKDMTPEAYNMYFSKGVFLCEDDCPVPDEILKTLNYIKPYTVKAGEYPITINGDIITVEF